MSEHTDAPDTALAAITRRPVPASLVTYSAVTWNPHRIHYDVEYVRGLGHPGVVVHGALEADWVLQWVAATFPGARVTRYSYRVLTPAYLGQDFTIGGARSAVEAGDGPDVVRLSAWVRNAAAETTLEGEVTIVLAAGDDVRAQ